MLSTSISNFLKRATIVTSDYCFLFSGVSMMSTKEQNKIIPPQPPICNKIKHSFTIHNEIINDDYAWLRDPNWINVQDKQIIDYLKEENKYCEEFFSSMKEEKDTIFEELKGRIKLTDFTPYVKKDNYYYYERTEEDKDYSIYCRKINSMDAVEEIILDANILAKDYSFFNIRSLTISPDHNLLAYSADFTGKEIFKIRILNLKTKEYLSDEVDNTSGNIVWHEKLNGFFYTSLNKNLRKDKLMFHYLADVINNDKLIYQLHDKLYELEIDKTSSKQYIVINTFGYNNNEMHIINMNDNDFHMQLIRPLKENIFYDIKHNDNNFYIKTNDDAKNFRIVLLNKDNIENNLWDNNYINEDKTSYLSSFDITKNYLILNYRFNGLPLIKIKKLNDTSDKIINFPDPSYTASATSTNYNEDDIRVTYTSLSRPITTYSYDFNNDKLTVLKIQEIPSGFNPTEYTVDRIFIESENVKVPVTIFYKNSLFNKNGSNPLYLYGYGSYGIAVPLSFRNNAISLVNRGFVYCIAHIRGGDDLGHDWYLSAKFLNKKRTFNDFIAATENLINMKYTSKGNVVICGGSAGGLLIGTVINMQPDLYKAAVAHVPFVDVLNTMLDDTLPLTPGEFKEWGNPKDLDYFNYIKSYSPYDNIKEQNYPNLFVTAGLGDPRVGYWEPAKWVAKLRDKKTDNNIILLKTNMDKGHRGSSKRFDYLKEQADDIVFIMNVFGIKI